MTMGKTKLAYTAGVVDGEGCIYIGKTNAKDPQSDRKYYHMEVTVGNTNEWLIQWLKFNFGGKTYVKHPTLKNSKVSFTWVLSSNKAAEFLKLILPYLNLGNSA